MKKLRKFEQQHQGFDSVQYAPRQKNMSWVAVGTTAVSVIGSQVAANQNKPGAPVYQAPIDIGTTSRKAISTNLENQGGIEALLSAGNTFNQKEASRLLETAMPGYSKLASNLTKLASDASANPYAVPKEVEDNLSRLAAEKGISVGGRGQFSEFSLLRDLGVNSLKYGESRINQAQSITSLLSGIAPKVNPMSPMSFYVSPNNALDVANGNATNAQATAQSYNNAKAATDAQNSTNMWNAIGTGAGSIFGALNKKNGKTTSGGDDLF